MIIKRESFVLRTLKVKDAPKIVEWLADPEITKFLNFADISLRDERNWIRSLRLNPEEYHFAIETSDGVHIGCVGFERTRKNNSAFFVIFIGDKQYWDKGLGTEITKSMIDLGFLKLRLKRICLFVESYNTRGITVYKRCGFKPEGILRKARRWNGQYFDTYIMGILNTEYFQTNGAK